MKFIEYINKHRKRYVINQVKNIVTPKFEPTPIVRKSMVFIGKVQRVGFRLELFELAKSLELSGWVKNRDDKSVEAQIQGESDKIDFLIEFMKSLKRATVKSVEIKDIKVDRNDVEFIIID